MHNVIIFLASHANPEGRVRLVVTTFHPHVNPAIGSGPRPRMKRSNDESNASFATAVQPNHLENASVRRLKPSRDETIISSSVSPTWKPRTQGFNNRSFR